MVLNDKIAEKCSSAISNSTFHDSIQNSNSCDDTEIIMDGLEFELFSVINVL